MNDLTEKLKNKHLYFFSLVWIIIFISACAGPRVASDLLVPTAHNNNPLLENAVIIFTEINPAISNFEGIDGILKESLELALKNSNIFGEDSSHPYRIMANILVASQPPMSFGNFEGQLKVNYILFDDSKTEILNETIYTEAGSDEWSFSGAKRHRRARAANIAKNVLQFVNILQNKFGR